jgi:hypothetical protein
MTVIQRIKGQPGASYEILFVDQHGHLIVALTEWYRLRSTLGPASTRDTYLSSRSLQLSGITCLCKLMCEGQWRGKERMLLECFT